MKSLTLISIFLFSLLAFGQAQKLPNKQERSIWAFEKIEIDGRPREWNNKFEAYNHSTQIYYKVVNDDQNFYLGIQAKDARIIEKMLSGGISVIIKDDAGNKGDIEIMYPLLSISVAFSIIHNSGGTTSAHPPIHGAPAYLTDTLYKPFSPTSNDSLKAIANLQLIKNANLIRVRGIANIEDPEISIYNDYGIKAASAFDHSGDYTIEFALPLKYIVMPADSSGKLNYTIKVNSRIQKGKHFRIVYDEHGIDMDSDLDTTTDFSAEYTLAKKP